MATVLVGVDLSDVTADVLEAAAHWSRDGDQLLLLHVAPEDPEFVIQRVGPEEEREEIARSLRTLRDRLDELATPLRAGGRSVDSLLVQGRPAERIRDEARRRNASLIVVGRHRHGRVRDALVGTVADDVIRVAPCSVLVVPAADAST